MQKPEFDSLPLTGWFPGHMLRAGRELRERVRLVDLVVELIDARVPATSRNPVFHELFSFKPRFLLFTKADLADPERSREWLAWLRQRGQQALFVNQCDPGEVDGLAPLWRRLIETQRRERSLAHKVRAPRILIAGVPNVGKSTLVNRLAASRRVAVGPKPGVTRQQQWVRLRGGLELLDTPGVLWPKLREKERELKLGLTGAIPDDLAGEELLAEYLWYQLSEHRARVDWQLYDLEGPPPTAEQLLEAVGRRRGLLRSGGTVDLQRSAVALLKDFRDGRIGRFTLDVPPMDDDEEDGAPGCAPGRSVPARGECGGDETETADDEGRD